MSELERDETVTGVAFTPERPWTDAEKLEMIARITSLQTDAQNEEPGSDPYQADAYLAMEAIELILAGNPAARTNGAFRTYFGD